MKKVLPILLAMIIAALATGTVLESSHGPAYAQARVYHTWWMIALWSALAIASVIVSVKQNSWRRMAVLTLHGSLLIILIGAMTTHLFCQSGILEMKPGESYDVFRSDRSTEQQIALPFSIRLDHFNVQTYPGGMMPMDYESKVTITESDGTSLQAIISMNNILKHDGYRFYQSDYDGMGGSTLQVSHDPWGIAISYTGYVLLLIALVWMFFDKEGQFQQMLKHRSIDNGNDGPGNSLARDATANADDREALDEATRTIPLQQSAKPLAILLLFLGTGLSLFASPRTLPRESAEEMGRILVSYKNRVCPLQTLARDFTTKLYGNPRYKGLTAEQVFSGFVFYYEDWQQEPIFKIKGGDVRQAMNLDGRYASFLQLADLAYQLKNDTAAAQCAKDKNFRAAMEKYSLIEMLYSGKMLKIYPHKSDSADVVWYSQSDDLPLGIADDEYLFIRKQMSLCMELAVKGEYDKFNSVMQKTRQYQDQRAVGSLPSPSRLKAERIYNRLSVGKPMAICSVMLGLVFFAISMLRTGAGKKESRVLKAIGTTWISLVSVLLLLLFVLRWIVGGHLPLAGSYDSMVFLSLCACIITLILTPKHGTTLPFGMLIVGLALMSIMMSGANPPVTNLMPVLSSPLLLLHVTVIMIAYAMLFFVMLGGIVGLFAQHDSSLRLQRLSLLLLYPAEALLTIGIFIGAVWANISWGNYWSWDPKEVWALITMLIYAVPLHGSLFPAFRNPKFFHIYCTVAFLSVLITYFGVNFILGGMHSYN